MITGCFPLLLNWQPMGWSNLNSKGSKS